jgi:hypothetical protein
MFKLSEIVKDWKESGALQAHVNLYGFWDEETFLTKSGDLGMVLRVKGIDYESPDSASRDHAVKRLEAALRAFDSRVRVYQALFKANETPQYQLCPENSGQMIAYLQEHPELDVTEVSSYQQAFNALNSQGKIKLQEPPRSEPEPDLESMSAAEYKRRVVVPEWQSRQKPKSEPSEEERTLKHLFESQGLAASAYNTKLVADFMNTRGLDYSVANLETAIEHLRGSLEVSDAVVERLPADVDRKVVVEPEFRERQSKQPTPKRDRPFGVKSWSSYIHSR